MICRFDEIKSLKIEEIIAQGEQEEFKEFEKQKKIWPEIFGGEEYNKEFSPSKTVCFTINKKQINPDNLEQLKTLAHQAKNMGYTIHIIVEQNMHTLTPQDPEIYTYTPQEMRVLIDFSNQLSELNIKNPIRFSELTIFSKESLLSEKFTINDVIKANSNIDQIVERIKSLKLTPFETMLYIHTYITRTFLYKENFGVEKSRSITGIYKDNSIVCSGYATLTKAIIDRLDIPELKCSHLSIGIYDKDLRKKHLGEHAQCLIQISDHQYGIQGCYVEDSTWDSKREKSPLGRGYAHCLFPVKDMLHFKDVHITQKFSNEQSVLNADIIGISQIEHYIRALKTPEVTKRYSNQSQPIPLETYYDALCYKIAPLIPEVEEGTISAEKWTQCILTKSCEVAQSSFDKKATNCFVGADTSKPILGSESSSKE